MGSGDSLKRGLQDQFGMYFPLDGEAGFAELETNTKNSCALLGK